MAFQDESGVAEIQSNQHRFFWEQRKDFSFSMLAQSGEKYFIRALKRLRGIWSEPPWTVTFLHSPHRARSNILRNGFFPSGS